jgi:hypothetical protein
MAEAPIIKTYRSVATGLILSICNKIGLVEHINQSVFRWLVRTTNGDHRHILRHRHNPSVKQLSKSRMRFDRPRNINPKNTIESGATRSGMRYMEVNRVLSKIQIRPNLVIVRDIIYRLRISFAARTDKHSIFRKLQIHV